MRLLTFLLGLVATLFHLAALAGEQALNAFDHWLGLRVTPKPPRRLHQVGYGGEYVCLSRGKWRLVRR